MLTSLFLLFLVSLISLNLTNDPTESDEKSLDNYRARRLGDASGKRARGRFYEYV